MKTKSKKPQEHADKPAKKEEWMYISLRMPVHMNDKIQSILVDRVGISRIGWILEAIQEKLKRDGNK